jgi:hypothetical protein
MGWGSYTFNEMLGWGSGFIDSWGSAGAQNRPGDTSHHVGIQTFHWSNGSNAYGWQMIGGVNENLWWRYSWNSPSGWYKIAMYDNNSSTSALWATWFRDSNNSGYYVDPDGTSSMNAIYYNNIYWQGSSAYGLIGYNAYFDTVNGRGGDPLELNYYDGGEVRIGPGGGNKNVMANAFYKGVNTSYYCNPTGYSQLSSGEFNDYCRIRRIDFTGVGGDSGVYGIPAYNIFQEGGGWGYPYPDLRIAYHTGIKLGANGPSYEGVRIYSDYDMSGILIQLSGPSNYSFWHTWQRLEGYHGIYSGLNSAHIYPNNITYGAWRIDGNRNGWYGHVIDSAYLPHYMWESGNGGCYLQNAGRWVFYHSLGNNCTGHGTSATSPSYGIYVNRGIYATENIVAYSDRRAKENIITIDNALDKIMNIRGVFYNRINDAKKVQQIGVIAQELEPVVPQAVTYCDVNDEYGVAYGNLAGLFIEAIKEQQQTINKQSEEIKELKEILNNLILNNK